MYCGWLICGGRAKVRCVTESLSNPSIFCNTRFAKRPAYTLTLYITPCAPFHNVCTRRNNWAFVSYSRCAQRRRTLKIYIKILTRLWKLFLFILLTWLIIELWSHLGNVIWQTQLYTSFTFKYCKTMPICSDVNTKYKKLWDDEGVSKTQNKRCCDFALRNTFASRLQKRVGRQIGLISLSL